MRSEIYLLLVPPAAFAPAQPAAATDRHGRGEAKGVAVACGLPGGGGEDQPHVTWHSSWSATLHEGAFPAAHAAHAEADHRASLVHQVRHTYKPVTHIQTWGRKLRPFISRTNALYIHSPEAAQVTHDYIHTLLFTWTCVALEDFIFWTFGQSFKWKTRCISARQGKVWLRGCHKTSVWRKKVCFYRKESLC